MSTDFTLFEGDSKSIVLTISDSTGAPVNLSVFQSIEWYVRRNISDKTNKMYKNLTGGVSITDATQGKLTITLSSSDSKGFNGIYFYEVKVTDQSDNSDTVASGRMFVIPTNYS